MVVARPNLARLHRPAKDPSAQSARLPPGSDIGEAPTSSDSRPQRDDRVLSSSLFIPAETSRRGPQPPTAPGSPARDGGPAGPPAGRPRGPPGSQPSGPVGAGYAGRRRAPPRGPALLPPSQGAAPSGHVRPTRRHLPVPGRSRLGQRRRLHRHRLLLRLRLRVRPVRPLPARRHHQPEHAGRRGSGGRGSPRSPRASPPGPFPSPVGCTCQATRKESGAWWPGPWAAKRSNSGAACAPA